MPTLVASGVGKVYAAEPAPRPLLAFGRKPLPAPPKETRALSDVSLTLQAGRIYGIVGPKGSGKTTLLRVLSGVTPLSEGRVEGRGKITALLDARGVLDMALTGRENIYAQAATMGWSRAEIEPHLDEIARFAGLEGFLDVRVARYSKGMALRLGFSFALNLRPQILFVDDVLRVGDIAFQDLCLERLREAADEGATVVIATHDMNHVTNLCDEVIWLNRGRIEGTGSPAEIVPAYLARVFQTSLAFDSNAASEYGRIVSVGLCDEELRPLRIVTDESDLVVEIGYEAFRPASALRGGVSVHWRDQLVFLSEELLEPCPPSGACRLLAVVPKELLSHRDYVVNVSVCAVDGDRRVIMKVTEACSFTVMKGRGAATGVTEAEAGALLRLQGDWTVSPINVDA